MEEHALAILGRDELWKRSPTRRVQTLGRRSGRFHAVAPKFLHALIVESQRLGGSVLDHFWKTLGTCGEGLKENVEMLKTQTFGSAQESFDVLFRGLDPDEVDFWPVLSMAGEFFTHLGIASMNPGGSKFETSTEYSISDALKEDRDTLYLQAKGGVEGEKESTQRQQLSLKALALKRDGGACLLTGQRFRDVHPSGLFSELACIIPHSVGEKSETLDCIAMFAGDDARHEVEDQLCGIGNVLVMELNAHRSYHVLEWGIEAVDEGGEVKYYFRTISTAIPPILVTLKDGDEIQFGKGPEGEEIEKPVPRLCNLELAVARVLKRSGAADIILTWLDDADDGGYRDCWMASHENVAMLDARLFLSGRAAVA